MTLNDVHNIMYNYFLIFVRKKFIVYSRFSYRTMQCHYEMTETLEKAHCLKSLIDIAIYL